MDALLRFSRRILIWLYNRNLIFLPGHSILKKFVLKRAGSYGTEILLDIQGFKLFINPQDAGIAPYLISYGVYEPLETKLFLEKLRPGMVVIDVGANIGYYSIMASKNIGPLGKVLAFEPEENNFKLLLKNIEINECKNIILVKKAISDRDGFSELFIHRDNLGMHSLVSDSSQNGPIRQNVETITLDAFIEQNIKNSRIDIIKIDVEGAEGRVLKGAKALLEMQAPCIFIEFCYSRLQNPI